MKWLLPLLLIFIFIGLTCKKKTESNPVNTTPPLTKATIGSEGGTVSTENFKLEIPSGAFSASQQIELYEEAEEQPFGESSVSPLYRIEGIPADMQEALKISIKYSGTLSEMNYILAGAQDTVDVLDTSYADVFYDLFDAEESDGYLIGEIPPFQTGSSTVSKRYQQNEGGKKLFVGGMTAKNPAAWLLFPNHFKITGNPPEKNRKAFN